MKKPNILLITSDQQHWNTLGATNPKIKTPNLDRLCRQGTRFTRAYCPNPTCTPTRASIITGLYPSVHGAWSLGTKLPEDVPTVGDALHRGGYATALIGKAHFQPLASTPEQTSLECQPVLRDLAFWKGFHGPWYGFDHIELARNHADEAHVGQHYALWLEEKGLKDWQSYFQEPESRQKGRHGAWQLPAELHYTTWTAESAIAEIQRNVDRNQPFFTWASFHDPHPPYLVPEPWASMYDPAEMEPGTLLESEMELLPDHFRLTQESRPDYSKYQETPHGNHGFRSHLVNEDEARRDMAIYYGMISFMDEQIGRILDVLDETGAAENTLIVFTTDHGHFLGQHGLWHKGAFHYEDLLRLPFLVRWPGVVPADTTSDALQSLVDLAPTFLRAAGLDIPSRIQGVDQLDVWRGQKLSAREDVIVEFHHQPTKLHLHTYVTQRYKMTIYRDEEYGELFDLTEDPDERQNLWANPACASLKGELFRGLAHSELRRNTIPQPRIAGA